MSRKPRTETTTGEEQRDIDTSDRRGGEERSAKSASRKKKNKFYFTTGCTLEDLIVGGGDTCGFGMGYEAGTIVRDWGDSSSTKTFKACETIAANYYKYKDKFKWKYADIEGGMNLDTMALYGIEIIPEGRREREVPKTVEKWEYDLHKFLDSIEEGECGIYVLDSLDALSSDATEKRKEDRHEAFDKDKEFDEGSYSLNSQKFLSQEAFRGLCSKLAEKNALLYIISQERDNINAGLYGKKNILGGGRAIKFYETARIYSKRLSVEEKKGRAVEAIIRLTAEKTRHPRPYRSCVIPVSFQYGIDDIGANIDFLYDCRSDKTGELLKNSAKLVWEEGKGEMSRMELISFIEENKLKKELKRRVIEKWEEIEESIATHRSSKFEEE